MLDAGWVGATTPRSPASHRFGVAAQKSELGWTLKHLEPLAAAFGKSDQPFQNRKGAISPTGIYRSFTDETC